MSRENDIEMIKKNLEQNIEILFNSLKEKDKLIAEMDEEIESARKAIRYYVDELEGVK